MPFDPDGCIDDAPLGIPPAFQISVSGITDGTCNECDELNGTFVLDFVQCGSWVYEHDGGICGKSFEYEIDPGDCSVTLRTVVNNAPDAVWEGSPPDGTCIDKWELDFDSAQGLECEDYPGTVEICAIDPDPEDVDKAGAVAAWNLSPALEVPTLRPAPDIFGPPSYDASCGTPCGCECGAGGDPSGPSDPGSPGGPSEPPDHTIAWSKLPPTTPPASPNSCGEPLPVPVLAFSPSPPVGDGESGSEECVQAAVNPATGNLTINFAVPGSGPGMAKPSVTYNSNSLYPAGDVAGPGWSAFWEQKTETNANGDSQVDVYGCDGSRRRYSCKDATTGEYKSPGMNPNTLVKNGDGSFTETEPSGREYHYNTDNELASVRQPATGERWTIVRSTGSIPPGPTHLVDPYSNRTTVSFDATSGDVSSIEDPHGRKTSFSVASGVHTISNAELCETKYKYKSGYGNERLIEWLELSDGGRYTFGYDSDGWIQTVKNPHNKTMTLTYSDFTTTLVDAFDGGRYTLAHSYRRNVKEVTSPEGVVTKYNWAFGRFNGKIPSADVRTTYIHDRFNGHRLLKAEVTPFGRKTYAYDANGLLSATTNLQGNRTTYLRDSNGLVEAIVEATGARTSYVYDSSKRPLAMHTPLGGRVTNVYDTGRALKASIDAFGNRTSYTYAKGMRQTVKTPLGNVSTAVYDDMNRVIARIDPLGNRSTFVYEDSCTGWVAAINPLGNRTTNIYDHRRLAATINPLGNRTTFGYDAAGRATTVKTPMGYVTTTVYNSDGRRVATISPAGLRATSVYDSSGRLLSTQTPNGARTTRVYSDNDQLLALIDPYDERSTTMFDESGRPIAEVNPLGARSTQVYASTSSQVLASIDPLGNRTTSVYNDAGQVIASIDALGNRTTTLFDIIGLQTATINALGNRTSVVYDDDRRAKATVNPLGHRSSTVYNAANRAIAAVSPLGYRLTTTYDAAGRIIAKISESGLRTTSIYDDSGSVIVSIEPRGTRTTITYDADSRVIAHTDALGNRTTTVFDSGGRDLATIDARGFRATTVYDTLGQPVALVNPLAHRTTRVYDSGGRFKATIDPLGNRYTSVFDAVGQEIAIVNPLTDRTTKIYDPNGRLIVEEDPNTNRTTTVFDAAARPVCEIIALGQRTTTVYNALGLILSMVDASGGRRSFVYDAAEQQTQAIDALDRRTTYSYDENGRQTLRIDARGNRASYTFADTGKLLSRQYPDGSRVTFAYDENGQQTLSADSTGRYTTEYDEVGRIRAVESPGNRTITYAYNETGNRVAMTAPDSGVFSYMYDANSQITTLHNPFGERTTFSYDAAGNRVVQRSANGTRASYAYDAAGNLSTLSNLQSDGTPLCTFDYGYDKTGRRSYAVEDSGDRVTWTYDAAYQLLAEHRSGTNAYAHTFVYDVVGNRSVSVADEARTTSTYDAANQLRYSVAVAGRTTYTFDADGNQRTTLLPSGARTTYARDYENRISEIQSPGDVRTTMTYKADGLRVVLTEAAGRTSFLWDEQNCLSQTGSAVHVFTNEPSRFGNIISDRNSGTSRWYCYDARGDTIRLSDAGSAPSSRSLYDAWGNLLAGPQRELGFGGQYGLYGSGEHRIYARGAQYAPAEGRWLSAGPSCSYQLANQDPINYVHPTRGSVYAASFSVGPSQDDRRVVIRPPKIRNRRGGDCPPAIGHVVRGQWNLSVRPRSPCHGFIVQQVTVNCYVLDCETGEWQHASYQYWEAFPIKARRGIPSPTSRDTTAFRVANCTAGGYEQLGELRLYCNGDIDPDLPDRHDPPLPPPWDPRGGAQVLYPIGEPDHICPTSAGNLASTGERPGFWAGPGQAQAARRSFAFQWSCCERCCGDGPDFVGPPVFDP